MSIALLSKFMSATHLKESAMSLFSTKQPYENRSNGNRYRPTESARVNETTVVDLWVNEKGTSWGLSRVNSEGGNSFRTMKPEQLGDAVEALAFLASIFSQDPNCPLDLKNDFIAMNRELQTVVDKAKNGFREQQNGVVKTGLLAA